MTLNVNGNRPTASAPFASTTENLVPPIDRTSLNETVEESLSPLILLSPRKTRRIMTVKAIPLKGGIS
jgi:hypothetical protein